MQKQTKKGGQHHQLIHWRTNKDIRPGVPSEADTENTDPLSSQFSPALIGQFPLRSGTTGCWIDALFSGSLARQRKRP